jgi:hypothetical protein
MIRWWYILATSLGLDSAILSARSVGGVFSPYRPLTGNNKRQGRVRIYLHLRGMMLASVLTHHLHTLGDRHDKRRGSLEHSNVCTILRKIDGNLANEASAERPLAILLCNGGSGKL